MLGPRRSGDLYTGDEPGFPGGGGCPVHAGAGKRAPVRQPATHIGSELGNEEPDERYIFASISTGVITTDLDRKVTLFNHAAEQILGLEAWQVMGRRLSRAVPGMGVDLDDVTASTLNDGAVILGTELMRQVPLRGDIVLRLSCSPLRDARLGTKGATLVFEDLTRTPQAGGRARNASARPSGGWSPRGCATGCWPTLGTCAWTGQASGHHVVRGRERFTTFSERYSPEVVFKVLNQYLSLATQAILEKRARSTNSWGRRARYLEQP